MTLFKPRVGKVIFAQTTGGLSVIIPKKKERRGTAGQNKRRRKERVGNQRKLQVVLINIKHLPPLSFIVLFLIRSWAGLNFGACE